MSIARLRAWALVFSLGLNGIAVLAPGQSEATAETEMVRKVRSRVAPQYPDLARKMNLTGTVKIDVVVGEDGTVKTARVAGGHPVLANAALDAVRKWKFERSSGETSGTVSVKFEPGSK